MAQEKVVIGCKGQGIEDVIEDNIDGLLMNPKDVEDLVVKMEYIINNEGKRDEVEYIA